MTRFSYSAPLDSIRALAVISVIIFHFSASALPGGYLGVDLFFVLSAFLITSIILQQGSEFSFKSFYNKRLKRILPPLYGMLLITSLASAVFLAKEDFNLLKESTEMILLFGANLFFARQGSGYFDPQISELPLLHTWSLAIEEQFYFIWPLILLLILKAAPRYRLALIAIASALCFGFCEWTLHFSSPNEIYYSSIGRFGQMLIGAFGALFISRVNGTPRFLGNIIFLGGLSAFTYFILFFNKSGSYPSTSAVAPTLACLAIVLGAFYSSGVLREVLSNSVTVWIGKISFSLYLWHWPFLAITRYTTDSEWIPFKVGLFLSVCILIVSVLSYYFVESKFRLSTILIGKAFTLLFLIPALSLSVLNLGTKYLLNKYDPSPASRLFTNRCHDVIRENCMVGEPNSKHGLKILAFGDSHMSHLNGFLDFIGNKEGWSATVLSAADCHPFLLTDRTSNKPISAACERMLQWVNDNLHKFDLVLLAGRWENYQLEKSRIETSIKYIKTNANKVVVFGQVKRPPVNPKKRRSLVNFAVVNKYEQTTVANELVRSALPSDVRWIDLYQPSIQLTDVTQNYFDTNHLSEVGSARLGEEFIKSQSLLSNISRTVKTTLPKEKPI